MRREVESMRPNSRVLLNSRLMAHAGGMTCASAAETP
jgi:hypothetical protein